MASDRPPHERERDFILPSRRRRPPLVRAFIVLFLVALVVWWLWALFVDVNDEGVFEAPENVKAERAEDAGWGGVVSR